MRLAGATWETDDVNSTFQNDTTVSCVAQRYASYTLLLVGELPSRSEIDPLKGRDVKLVTLGHPGLTYIFNF